MAQIRGYTFNEGSGTTAAEVGGGTSITGVPGWAAGRHGNAMSLTSTVGPTTDPYVTDTNFTIMWDVYINGAGAQGYNIMLQGGSNFLGIIQSGPSGSGDLEWYHDSAGGMAPVAGALTASTWTNIAISADGTTRKLYLNGTVVASRATSLRSADNPIQLGGLDSGYIPNFRMDNLRFFDTALTEGEVLALSGTPVAVETVTNTVNLSDSLVISDVLTRTFDGPVYVNLADALAITDTEVPQSISHQVDTADNLVVTDAVSPTLTNNEQTFLPVFDDALGITDTITTLLTVPATSNIWYSDGLTWQPL